MLKKKKITLLEKLRKQLFNCSDNLKHKVLERSSNYKKFEWSNQGKKKNNSLYSNEPLDKNDKL